MVTFFLGNKNWTVSPKCPIREPKTDAISTHNKKKSDKENKNKIILLSLVIVRNCE